MSKYTDGKVQAAQQALYIRKYVVHRIITGQCMACIANTHSRWRVVFHTKQQQEQSPECVHASCQLQRYRSCHLQVVCYQPPGIYQCLQLTLPVKLLASGSVGLLQLGNHLPESAPAAEGEMAAGSFSFKRRHVLADDQIAVSACPLLLEHGFLEQP